MRDWLKSHLKLFPDDKEPITGSECIMNASWGPDAIARTACSARREEWTKAIQTVAVGLQKQEEEMMDSSPDPMDMEAYLTKPRQKVVRQPLHLVPLLWPSGGGGLPPPPPATPLLPSGRLALSVLHIRWPSVLLFFELGGVFITSPYFADS